MQKRESWLQRGVVSCALVAVAVAPFASCSTSRIAHIEYAHYYLKGVCKITVGQGNVNWWLLSGSISSVDLTPENGTQLANATLRLFDDANGNGAFDTGENSKSFQSSTSSNGLSFSNVQLSAGDVANWNADRVSCAIEVTDSTGKVHTWSSPL